MRELRNIIGESVAVKQRLLNAPEQLQVIEDVASALSRAFTSGRKALFCGNGGSAADAQHLAAEFSGRFLFDRDPLPAEALHVNTSYLTAVANDYSYDAVYARIVAACGVPGDVFFGLTTSGNSPNVVKAAEVARERELVVVGMTGEGGGLLKEHCTYLIEIPSTVTAHIQESHITVGHAIAEIVEACVFPR